MKIYLKTRNKQASGINHKNNHHLDKQICDINNQNVKIKRLLDMFLLNAVKSSTHSY